MKIHKVKFRVVDKDNFNDIKSGKKIYETRAATVKYRSFNVGDILEVSCGKDKVSKKIVAVSYYPSLTAMLKAIPLKKIMPDMKTEAEARKRWYGYPNYREKIKQNGLVALRLK